MTMLVESNCRYETKEMIQMPINIEVEDKKKFISLVDWSGKAINLSNKEQNVREAVQPMRGSIWTVEFGENVGTETSGGARPCLIVQENNANEKASTIVGVPITRHMPRFPSHMKLREYDYQNIEVDKKAATGTIMTEQMRVLSKGRLGERIGQLSEKSMKNVERSILSTLGIRKQAKKMSKKF